jgi:hypothetical protein
MAGEIQLTYLGNMSYEMHLQVTLLFSQNSLPVGKYCRFSISQGKFCPAFFLETIIDMLINHSELIDLC